MRLTKAGFLYSNSFLGLFSFSGILCNVYIATTINYSIIASISISWSVSTMSISLKMNSNLTTKLNWKNGSNLCDWLTAFNLLRRVDLLRKIGLNARSIARAAWRRSDHQTMQLLQIKSFGGRQSCLQKLTLYALRISRLVLGGLIL